MQMFAEYDVIDPARGQKVATGHKASFCLEDVRCMPGVPVAFQCKGLQAQGKKGLKAESKKGLQAQGKNTFF